MFHYKLIELEAEIAAKKQSEKGFSNLPVECEALLQFIEKQVELKLGDQVPKGWAGWLSYRRNKHSLIICRGREFKAGMMGKLRAGLDVTNGLDSIRDYDRGFDVSPPQDLDHLLMNFGGTESMPKVFLWYGENIAPYKLIFMAQVETDPHTQLTEAVVEACTWILQRPKGKTLTQFLAEK